MPCYPMILFAPLCAWLNRGKVPYVTFEELRWDWLKSHSPEAFCGRLGNHKVPRSLKIISNVGKTMS